MHLTTLARAAVGPALVSMVAAACAGGTAGQSPAASRSPASPAAQSPMPLPPGAEKMKVTLVSPANGAKITDNAVTLQVKIEGFQPSCDLEGKSNKDGIGHFHVLFDKALVDAFCVTSPRISFQNVKPGSHTIAVVPALNDHAEVEQNEQQVTVDYQPTKPLPEITAAGAAAKPGIRITQPADGATLSGGFDVAIEVSNFGLSCDLEGKPDVAGFGHWHLNLDTDTGPMMGMMTMLGMSCQKTFHATTEGMTTGRHSLIALLVDNSHAPIKVSDKIEIVVK